MKSNYTKKIMTASALMLGLAGIILTFIPDAVLIYFNLQQTVQLLFLIQIFGALYFAFAMLNWMTRTSIVGGIYNKPIAVANFSHFFIGGIALAKGVISNPALSYTVWFAALVYGIFAVCFGIIFSRNPVSDNKPV